MMNKIIKAASSHLALTVRKEIFLMLIFFAAATLGQEPQKYAPGVPPHKGNEEIKFHDPSDFATQTHHQGGAHPESRVSHTHSFRGGASDHEKEHLKSHVHEEYIDVENLSEPQMIMQHFRNYDLDKNGNIDGLEILKAANKMNEEHASEGDGGSLPALMDLVDDTDETVRAYDDNDDGLIHYGEFYRNHQKALRAASEASQAH